MLLQVAGEAQLIALQGRCEGIPSALVREPDLGDSATALALGEGAKKLVSSLPLAFRFQKEKCEVPFDKCDFLQKEKGY